jgi:xylulokinase
MRYVLGIDIGSSSTKGVIVDETGVIMASAQRAHRMRVPAPGLAEHDPEADWWQGFITVSQALLADTGIDPASISAVGCSGIGPCVLPLDETGTPLRSAILYGVDTRAHRQIETLNAELGAEAILERCGNALTTQSVGPKVRWIADNQPEIFAKTRKIVSCTTFLVHRLTGRWSVDHYSASTATPFYDLHRRAWNDDWIRQVCPPEWMPDLYWSGDVVGQVTDVAARVTGLAPGTPVIAGTIDAAAEALSVGVSRPGDLMIMYGTTVFMIQVATSPSIDRRYWAAPWIFPDTWAVMGGLSGGGSLTQWFRDEIVGAPEDDSFFSQMADAVRKSLPGANGLIVLPYFSGERTPINDPHARGVCFGMTLSHKREDLYRAILEGIGHAVRHNLDTFAENTVVQRAFAVGGGVQNEAWIQGVSDIAGIEQIISKHFIGASFGSAILAGIGTGVFSMEQIGRLNPEVRRVEPESALAECYGAHHEIYLELYRRTRDLMETVSRLK